MTTPPIPPDRPAEPASPWAPPAHPPYPAPRTSRASLIVIGSLVLLAGLLAAAYQWVSPKHDVSVAIATTTVAPPTTTTPPKPIAEVGDCVKLTGTSLSPTYQKVSCEGGLHNYVVSKVPATDSEKCGEDADGYTRYTSYQGVAGRQSVCLVPVFVEGQCYDFTLSSLQAETKTAECGGFQAVRAKVLTNTVDKAACGESPALALAYPEIKTTYCFTHTFTYGN
jgi:hypothetical protein